MKKTTFFKAYEALYNKKGQIILKKNFLNIKRLKFFRYI